MSNVEKTKSKRIISFSILTFFTLLTVVLMIIGFIVSTSITVKPGEGAQTAFAVFWFALMSSPMLILTIATGLCGVLASILPSFSSKKIIKILSFVFALVCLACIVLSIVLIATAIPKA